MAANIFINRNEGRLRALWRLLLQSAFFLGGNLLVGLPIGILAAAIFISQGGNIQDVQGLLTMAAHPVISTLGSVAALMLMLLSCWLAARWLDRRPFRDYGFHFSARWWADFGFGLFLGALLMLLIFAIELAAGWVQVTGYLHSYLAGTSFLGGLLAYVVVYFCVGIYEELWSRGYQLRNLAEGLNFRPLNSRSALLLAYLVSSSIFGLLHAGNPNATAVSTLNIIVAGLFLGLGFILTGNLAISIGLHMTWNFFQGCVFGFPVSGTPNVASFIAIRQVGPQLWTGGAFGPEAGLIGLAAIALGCLLIAGWVRWRHGRLALQDWLALYRPRRAVEAPHSAGPGPVEQTHP